MAKDTVKHSEQQAPQATEDKHGPKYDNDTPDNWLRGCGQNPNFDKRKGGR